MGIYGHTFDNYRLDINQELLDENMITDTLKKFIDGIKKVIVSTIDKINGLLDKHPDSKIAQGLKSLLTKFKNFLTRADKVNNKEEATKLKSDVDEANKELKAMTSSSDTSYDEDFYKYCKSEIDKGNNNKNRVSNMIINSIRNGFLNCANKLFKYAEDKGYIEDYKSFSNFEEYNNKTDWNKEYLIKITFYLGENLCSKRFNHCKEVYRYING